MAPSAVEAAAGPRNRLIGGIEWFLAVPFRKRTYLTVGYLLLAFPLGLAYFVALVVGLSVGIALSILLVGIPILGLVVLGSLVAVQFERWLTSRLLPVEVRGTAELQGERYRDQAKALFTDRRTWTGLVYLPSVFAVGLVAFVVVTTGLSTALALLLVPFYYDQPGLYVGVVSDRAPEFSQTIYLAWNQLLVGFEAVLTVGAWEITTLPQAIAAAVGGVVLLVLTIHALNALGRLFGWYARLMLDGGYDVTAVLQSTGAEQTGDSSVGTDGEE